MESNKSYVYAYPMIEDKINYETNLLGCYIGDKSKPEYNNHIFLRYKFDGKIASKYLKFEEEIQNCTLLEDFYDVEGDKKENSVMFVFNIPEEHKTDFRYFIESKYSKLSNILKKKIIAYHGKGNKANEELLKGILYKTKEYQLHLEEKIGEKLSYDAEFSSKWEEQKEIFVPTFTTIL